MRIAALYDIHGNLPALEAVLKEVQQLAVDQVVVGGDVAPGPMPRECLEQLIALPMPTTFIHGNGESALLAVERGEEFPHLPAFVRELARWTVEQLPSSFLELVAGWPPTYTASTDGLGDIFFCHATPRNDTEIFTRLTPEEVLRPIFASIRPAVAVCGHTHMPFDRQIGDKRVLNAGSVGMPFGRSGADWLLLGPDIELRHTDYDLAEAAERIRRTNYPQANDFAANNVLNPPSEEAMLMRFKDAELT